MAVVTFSKPVGFPIGALREALAQHVPGYRWQCGEDDDGRPQQKGTYASSGIIQGRSGGSLVFTEYRARPDRFPDAPRHDWYLELFAPTTEDRVVADRITAVICATAMTADEDGAHCRLVDGGPWLPAAAMPGVLRALAKGATLADAVAQAGAGIRGTARSRHEPARAIDTREADARARAMPMLMLMADRMLQPDWPALLRFAQAVDADGDWALLDGRREGLAGRGTKIVINRSPDPAPPILWQECLPNSFWYQGDRAALAGHRSLVTIGTLLDPAACPYETVRQVAKVMTMAAGILSRLPGAVALVNATTRTLYAADTVCDMLEILGRDELPVALWARTLAPSLHDGDASLATAGLAPLIGHEVEIWNAPLTVKAAGDRLGDIIRYLLDRGPVIGHGDTMGDTPEDRAVRAFLGPSRIPRDQAVQALFLEFEAPEASAPRPDRPEPAKPPMNPGFEGVLRGVAARMGSDDPTGMGDVIRSMLRDNDAAKAVHRAADPVPPPVEEDALGNTAVLLLNRGAGLPRGEMLEQLGLAFPERRWTIDDSDRGLNVPRTVTGTGGRGTITARIVAHRVPLAEAGAPPHLGHVTVDIATDDGPDAVFLAAIVCACLVIERDTTALCRLAPGTPWIEYDALLNQMCAVKHLRRAPAPAPPPPVAAAGFGRRVGGFGRKGL